VEVEENFKTFVLPRKGRAGREIWGCYSELANPSIAITMKKVDDQIF
jgi:hypothetical protein